MVKAKWAHSRLYKVMNCLVFYDFHCFVCLKPHLLIRSVATVWCSNIMLMLTYSISSHFAAELTPNILFSQLLKSSEGPLLRRRRHLESSKSYIAAKLLSLPTTFTLGDMKNYNGFYNKPLNTDQEYLSFVMAVLQNNETDSTANYVRLTCAHQHTCRFAFQRKRAIRKY